MRRDCMLLALLDFRALLLGRFSRWPFVFFFFFLLGIATFQAFVQTLPSNS